MASPGDFHSPSPRQGFAGVISKIQLENFMCHSNLVIELGDYVNFITGQNGSGKSAILTALCVAFGCRARDTNRASTLKDFIKTGCSYASVHVEIKNQGVDAFKPEIYGDVIILERKISDSTSSTILKDNHGRKVASRKDELRELVDHFNIDVENPCVIMSQDKSREFLHSGNAKDKFKFFFKATLLQQVNDLLLDIRHYLSVADGLLQKLEGSIKPFIKELNELQVKIKNMEHVEGISLKVQQLRKKLAWSWVYDVDTQLEKQIAEIEKLKGRIPTCQSKIDSQHVKVEELKEMFNMKKTQVSQMVEKTSEVRRMKEELEHQFSLVMEDRHELEEEHNRKTNLIEKMVKRVRLLEQQIRETQELHFKNTQAEESEFKEKLKELEGEVNAADLMYTRYKEEEKKLLDSMFERRNEIQKVSEEIDAFERKYRETISSISELRRHQGNKVTAFGGDRVLNLLHAIEINHYAFKKPPIGPIGAHVTLLHDDMWAPAVENAFGKLLNAFIVTDHKDLQVLRECAKEANYGYLQIIIYDFLRPKLSIPIHMLPRTHHPTNLSVIHSENITVLNVLIDVGGAERQVLVKDYEVGKTVAFDPRISNLKEVFTLDGFKMFFRGSVQTILPPRKRSRTGRLCKSFDDQIKSLEQDTVRINEQGVLLKCRKRILEQESKDFQDPLQNAKRRCLNAERNLMSKKLHLSDVKKSFLSETNTDPISTVDELCQEISKVQEEMNENKILLEKLQVKMNGADANARDVKLSLQNLCESAKGEIDAFEETEQEMIQIEENLHAAAAEKLHYEGLMKNKVLADISVADAKYRELEHNRKENSEKASVICPESEIQDLGGCVGRTPEELSAQLNRLKQTLRRESNMCDESIDDLRMMYEKKQRKISRKKQTYDGFREKLTTCEKALDLRWSKFQRNASLLKRQLTWHFNGHLGKKGVSGLINVDYEQKTLSIEVKMPHDASSQNIRDTRGLSGGERSFSTLCFTLALHGMTEAPFRAMDEFDVFMDAVSRKISLDTLVDFALDKEERLHSQWIFITPHDISMVKNGERIKKQQMAAPRS